jgi:diguanylate cyclase (GGDEF)-like protein
MMTVFLAASFWTMAGEFLLVVGGAFIVLCVVTSLARFHIMTSHERGGESSGGASALSVEMSRRLGTVHRSPEPFGLMLCRPASWTLWRADLDEATQARILLQFETAIRGGLRKMIDWVGPYEEGRIAVVTAASRSQCEGLVDRLHRRLIAQTVVAEEKKHLSLGAQIGVAASPEDGMRVSMLVQCVEHAFETASQEPGEPRWRMASSVESEVDEFSSEAPAESQPGLVDELTGVLRRDRLIPAMHRYLAQHRRRKQPVSVFYIDIDHLSRYNEHYGREAGDAVLRELSKLLQSELRETDLIARCRDDEFVVLLTCAAEDAMIAALRLITSAKKTTISLDRTHLKATISIGVASYPKHGVVARRLLSSAYTALHATKANGISMSALYEPTMRPPIARERRSDVF